MIALDPISDTHFIMRANEPVRIEVSTQATPKGPILIAHVYTGEDNDLEQEPSVAFISGDSPRAWTNLEGVASHAAGYGLLSGEGEETVDWWSAKVLELPDQDER